MSWLARSIANTLKLDEEDEDDDYNPSKNAAVKAEQHDLAESPSLSSDSTSAGRGVKEDLSELTKTLSRQFWGVASFLAPPPETDSDGKPREPSDPENCDAAGISGVRSDFVEIGGRFKSGISKLSNNIAVSEFTKIASNFLQLAPEEYSDSVRGAVGVTEEVVAFARDIAMHPETWMDFPLPEDEDDEDFDMSDAQQEHALAVERLAPRLAALRIELCPSYMSESCFWKIYFVLVHPRLGKQDAEVLSTPQVMKARALLTLELQNHSAKPEKVGSSTSCSKDISNLMHEESLSVPSSAQSESLTLEAAVLDKASSGTATDIVTEKHTDQITEIPIIDKSVIDEGPFNNTLDRITDLSSSFKGDEDDGDDWLQEESSETVGASGATIPIANDEDVSFSDLEEDDGDMPMSNKKVTYNSDSSAKDSRNWVQLSRKSTESTKDINTIPIERTGSEHVSVHNPENKESTDWLDVDDIDVA